VRSVLLEVKNLYAGYYAEQFIIKNVSITLNKREIVCLVGPNGAGKTTLLRSIVGLIKFKSGEITFNDRRIDNEKTYKISELGIAMVPEGRRILPKHTVLENLELGAYTKRAREKFKETLEFVYNLFPILKERSQQKGGTLSGGEQQMLAIGRALMSRPLLLLVDELTLGLAPKIASQLFRVVVNLKQEGITVLLVDQNVYKSLSVSDKGYVLEDGVIRLHGRSDELLKNEYLAKCYFGLY